MDKLEREIHGCAASPAARVRDLIYPFMKKLLCSTTILAALLAAGCSRYDNLPPEKKAQLAELEKRMAQTERDSANPDSTPPDTQKPSAPAVDTAAPASEWHYEQLEDKMTGGATHLASVTSTNTVNFDFPYQGEQHGTVRVRIDPKYGKDVMFSIERGQILCLPYQGCDVLVRFDDEKPISFPATGAADNSSDTIFLRNYAKFVDKLAKAKRVRISPNIYQQGSPVFEFNVAGFSKEKLLGKG